MGVLCFGGEKSKAKKERKKQEKLRKKEEKLRKKQEKKQRKQEKKKQKNGCFGCGSKKNKDKKTGSKSVKPVSGAEQDLLFTVLSVPVKSVSDGDGIKIAWEPKGEELPREAWDLVNKLKTSAATFDKKEVERCSALLEKKYDVKFDDKSEKVYKELRVRFRAIDAPERNQVFGAEAWEYVKKRLEGKLVTVRVYDKDQYGRAVADVIVLPENKILNEELVAEGMAWHYKAYDNRKHLEILEQQARTERKGLWREPNPIPPWEFRKQSKKTK
mmetsp:Transcript_10527/g.18997  ORF Transcript_10527/g.18997 Transcript_10527/m.18997 type:complete len:272 (-) Transcript_10527:1796-2611(-)